jgi:integrase
LNYRQNMALFEPFCISWLATWAAVKLKASAYQEYESVTRLHLIPAFGDLRLEELGPDRIQSYVASRLTDGLASRTVDNHLIVLKRILGVAVDYGLIAENPVNFVARPRVERAEMKFLTPSQLRELIEATEPSWRLLIAMAGLCGLRKGEILALEWSDLDLEAMTVAITKSMRAGVTSSPKTRSSIGQIPLPETLSSYIAQRRRQAGGHKLVFCRRDGRPLSDSLPNRVLDRALIAAHLPSIRFHDLRHSWAVAHLRAGTDIKTLAALGRWSSPMTLLQVYAHVIPAIGGDAVRRFDEFVHESLNA